MKINQAQDIAGARVFLVGIKGTGMSALAEVLLALGAQVCGSDSEDTFYTDTLINALSIPVYRLDEIKNIQEHEYDFVVHSAAYNRDTQPQLQYFHAQRIPTYTYPQILGTLSKQTFSIAIAGVHGKTTISGMSATIASELALNGLCVVGGQIHSLGEKSTYINGTQFFLSETCEYRRHFLNFYPHILAISHIELDHQDYFSDNKDIYDAFLEFAMQIRTNGTLIYCGDDMEVSQLAKKLCALRSDIHIIPYGRSVSGAFRIEDEHMRDFGMRFTLNKWPNTNIDIPLFGAHMVSNATAALAITDTIQHTLYESNLDIQKAVTALRKYRGAKRRMEMVGSARGITVIDDYAHHPTAIKATLSAFRQSKKYKRIIVDFMPHTYSRTRALLDAFTTSFSDADVLITHQIYSSAREANQRTITGEQFATAIRREHDNVHYFPRPRDATQFCLRMLRPGDAFITLGAGDNWKLGKAIYNELTKSIGAQK